MAGGWAFPAAWPVPLDPGLRDLRALRLGSSFGALGFAAINAVFVYFGFLRVAGGGGSFGLALTLLFFGHMAAAAFAGVGIAFGAGAGMRHVRLGASLAMAFPVAGLVLGFAAPALLVVLLGEAPSPSWWNVYVAFLPGSLLVGAHVALLEAARPARGEPFRPLFLLVPAIAGALGPVVSMLALFYSFRFGSAAGLGLALSAAGFACDAALFLWAAGEGRRRQTGPWPMGPQSLP